MTIRTKIWLIAVSVATAVGVASWGRLYLTRTRIIKDAQTSAEELAHDIAEDLKSVEADADDRDLEEKLLGYLNRHSRIVRLDLYVYRESSTPSSRIAAPRGDRPEITRFAPFNRQPLGFTKQGAGEAQETPIEIPVDLKGPWGATLVMRWTLGPVEAMLETEERISLIFGAGLLVALTLLSGLITDKVDRPPARGAGGRDARRRGRRPVAPRAGRDRRRGRPPVARFQPHARTPVASRRADPRVQPAPGRRDRGGDARSLGEERDAGAAQPPAQRDAPRERVEGAPGDAGPAGGAAGARDRHAAVVGVRATSSWR